MRDPDSGRKARARRQAIELQRRARTLEGIRDVDEGRLVEHEVIEAWARAHVAPRHRRSR